MLRFGYLRSFAAEKSRPEARPLPGPSTIAAMGTRASLRIEMLGGLRVTVGDRVIERSATLRTWGP